jgi:hypothetical protein
MEHHLHMVVTAPELRKTIKEFKSFTARRIIDYFKGQTALHLMDKVKEAKLQYKTKSEYQVWQKGVTLKKFTGRKCPYKKLSVFITILFGEDMWMNRDTGNTPAQEIMKMKKDCLKSERIGGIN